MKKIFSFIAILFCISFMMSSCHSVSPDADEEAVLIYKPWFFGHGGVDEDAVEPGLTWCWWSTHSETFKTIPVKYQVNMDDLVSDDNTPLDFHTIIITQIEKGKSPILLQNYGKDWFNTNLYNYYCNIIRDHISQHNPFDLMSNRQILNEIDKKVLAQMRTFVAELSKNKEFPVIIKQVTIGKAMPNEDQKNEMNRTAKAVQASAAAAVGFDRRQGLVGSACALRRGTHETNHRDRPPREDGAAQGSAVRGRRLCIYRRDVLGHRIERQR